MARPAPRRLLWTNTLFLAFAHLMALVAVGWMVFVQFSWWTLALGFVWLNVCTFAISAGYHRLFSHRAYDAHPALRASLLAFGAASVQNSALRWSADHRRHHAWTDTERDPYNAQRGFWWSHVGWVLVEEPRAEGGPSTQDLESDRLVRVQHRWYVALALLFGGLVPMALGLLWGDPVGALLVAGFLRLVVQWHVTFSINSLAHIVGSQPYGRKTSARDSWLIAFFTFGEGYHNFHHRFPLDYRNGWRWYHFDPSKWLVWSLSWVGITRKLRRTSREAIARARALTRTVAPGTHSA